MAAPFSNWFVVEQYIVIFFCGQKEMEASEIYRRILERSYGGQWVLLHHYKMLPRPASSAVKSDESDAIWTFTTKRYIGLSHFWTTTEALRGKKIKISSQIALEGWWTANVIYVEKMGGGWICWEIIHFALVRDCFTRANHYIRFNFLLRLLYICRTAQLTSRRCILNIYSTNIITEYFKYAAHSPFFSLQDAVYFIMLPFLVPVIFTF